MLDLEFNDSEEFNNYFDPNNDSTKKELTEAIFQGIREAHMSGSDDADLFVISFVEEEDVLDVSLSRSEWDVALKNCQEKFHELEQFDDAIDAYNLRKAI